MSLHYIFPILKSDNKITKKYRLSVIYGRYFFVFQCNNSITVPFPCFPFATVWDSVCSALICWTALWTAPFALLIWMLMYLMFVSCFLGYTNLFVGVRPPAVMPHGRNGGVQRGVTPLAQWGVFSISVSGAWRKRSTELCFLFPKSLQRCRRLVFAFLFLPVLHDIPCRCAGTIVCRHMGIQAGIALPFPQRTCWEVKKRWSVELSI